MRRIKGSGSTLGHVGHAVAANLTKTRGSRPNELLAFKPNGPGDDTTARLGVPHRREPESGFTGAGLPNQADDLPLVKIHTEAFDNRFPLAVNISFDDKIPYA